MDFFRAQDSLNDATWPLIPSHNYRIENMSSKQDLQDDLLCTIKARKRKDS